jgi:hypothetical protein
VDSWTTLKAISLISGFKIRFFFSIITRYHRFKAFTIFLNSNWPTTINSNAKLKITITFIKQNDTLLAI